ncbi:MAG: hypothetical protein QM749_06710, partial [Aquabacterium sp.]
PATSVWSAPATSLSNQRSAVLLRRSQLTASVNLITAMGGGWHADDNSPADTPSAPSSAASTPMRKPTT